MAVQAKAPVGWARSQLSAPTFSSATSSQRTQLQRHRVVTAVQVYDNYGSNNSAVLSVYVQSVPLNQSALLALTAATVAVGSASVNSLKQVTRLVFAPLLMELQVLGAVWTHLILLDAPSSLIHRLVY